MPLPAEVEEITDAFLATADRATPGLVTGLFLHGSLGWGEWFPDSDIDFVATVGRAPNRADLTLLARVHGELRERFPSRRFEGFYCRADDLADSPDEIGPLPVHAQGSFDFAGRLDVNLVTWHELAERAVVVRGELPPVHTDLAALLALARDNLRTYWTQVLRQVDDAGPDEVGRHEASVTWVTLGVARLHHLLARRELTSKSGAGRYVLESLDPRWHLLARDALAIRERPGEPSGYDDPADRGRDVRGFLSWVIEDGRGLP